MREGGTTTHQTCVVSGRSSRQILTQSGRCRAGCRNTHRSLKNQEGSAHVGTQHTVADRRTAPMGLRSSDRTAAGDAAADQRSQHRARPSGDDRDRRCLVGLPGDDHHQRVRHLRHPGDAIPQRGRQLPGHHDVADVLGPVVPAGASGVPPSLAAAPSYRQVGDRRPLRQLDADDDRARAVVPRKTPG